MSTTTADRRTDIPHGFILDESDLAMVVAKLNAENALQELRIEAAELAGCLTPEQLQKAYLQAETDRDERQIALTKTAILIHRERGDHEGQEKELFIAGDRLFAERLEVKRLVGKLLQRGTVGQIYGPSGGGKSFVAIGIACSIATGTAWNGHDCEQGLALYFVGEGYHGMKKRLRAWLKKHDNPPGIENLVISKSTVTLDPAGIRRVIAEARAHETRTGRKVALIVIDTLARHILGDENITRDMSEFINSVAAIQDAFPDSTAIIVHHTGHNSENSNRSRGSSALRAALDFEIQCDKGLLTFQKVKDDEIPPPIEFKLIPVEVGTDDEGDPITSCYVHYGERSAKNREVSLTKAEKEIIELVDSNPGIFLTDLRTAYFEKRRGIDPETKYGTIKAAFRRAMEGLIDKQQVAMDGNTVTRVQGTNRVQTGYVYPEGMGTNGYTPLKGCTLVPSYVPESDNHIDAFDDVLVEVAQWK